MTITSKKLATTATFAAALTSLYAAPELQADVAIDFLPGDEGIILQFQTVDGSFSAIGEGSLFSLFATPSSPTSGFSAGSFGANLARVGLGELSAGNFPSGTSINSFVSFTADETGTEFIGFQFIDGRVGFFQVDFGAAAGDGVEFVSGRFGSVAGESVTVAAAVPEPASGLALAALALGAVGIRRKRQVA